MILSTLLLCLIFSFLVKRVLVGKELSKFSLILLSLLIWILVYFFNFGIAVYINSKYKPSLVTSLVPIFAYIIINPNKKVSEIDKLKYGINS